jgi:hypothetical protein
MVPSETQKYTVYPLPAQAELTFKWEGKWVPTDTVVVEKMVVNRAKAKEARAPYKPFLDWAKTFLKMSDGWIMHETRKSVVGVGKTGGFHYTRVKKELLGMILEGEENYLNVMCHILDNRKDAIRSELAEVIPYEWEWQGAKHIFKHEYHNMQFRFDLLKNRVYRMIEDTADIYDKVQVEVSDKFMSDVI